MKLNRTGSRWDRNQRININDNWDQIESENSRLSGIGKDAENTLKEALRINAEAERVNKENVSTQKQVDDLILHAGQSDAEVIQARGGLPLLKDRLDESDAQLAQIATNVKSPPIPMVGAKGDGITDDIVAIQGVMDYVASNGGGTVYFPKGKYHISDTIEITGDNIGVTGEGYSSHIKPQGDFSVFSSTGYDNLSWTNLRIEGVRTDDLYNGYGHGIVVYDANNILIENNYIEKMKGKAIHLSGFYKVNLPQGVHDSWVVNNCIDHCGDGIMVYNDGRRVEVSGNKIFRCTNIGIYIDDSHQPDGVEVPRKSTRINVENNYFEDMMGTTAINFAGTDYSSARGNYILNGGQSANKNINAISIQTVQNHVPARNNIIEGNTIVGQTNIAIDLVGASNNIIRNNNMVNNSLNRPSGNAPTIKMQSNTIRDVIFGSSQNIIENNLSLSNDPNSNTSVHVMIDDADCLDNIIRYNVFNGGAHYEPTTNRGTNTIQKDNLFNGVLFHNGFEDGSKQEPSFYFDSDRDTGFYRVGEGDVGFSSNGEWTMRFRNGMEFNNGNDVQFGTGTGSRFGSSPLQKLGFWGRTPVTQPENIPQTSGATLQELEQEVNKLKKLISDVGLMG